MPYLVGPIEIASRLDRLKRFSDSQRKFACSGTVLSREELALVSIKVVAAIAHDLNKLLEIRYVVHKRTLARRADGTQRTPTRLVGTHRRRCSFS
jgi:hypothetical protein